MSIKLVKQPAPTTIRLDEETQRRIKEAAKRGCRSMSAEILYRIRRSLDDEREPLAV